MPAKHRRLLFVAYWLLGSALAQSAPALLPSAPPPSQFPDTVAKGTREIAIWGGGGAAAEAGGTRAGFNTSFVIGGTNVAWVLTHKHGPAWLRGTPQYGFGVTAVSIDTAGKRVYGGSIDPIVTRWHFTHFHRRLYLELDAGGLFTNSDIPPGDTSTFNFFPRIGFGWRVMSGARRSLDATVMYWHVSNAKLGRSNPSLNGVQLVLGYHQLKLPKRDDGEQ